MHLIRLVAVVACAASLAFAQDTLPTTQIQTCGCFTRVVGGTMNKYCGTNCQIPTCLANQGCPAPSVPGAEVVPSQVRWGRSATPNAPDAQSGMGFTGVFPPVEVPLGREFYVGKLTHFNLPIYTPASQTTIRIGLTIPEFSVSESFSFDLIIDETPNNEIEGPCPYPSTTPCSDRITFNLAGLDFSRKFTISGVEYTLQLTGFKESRVSTSFSTEQFISNERRENNAFLFGQIVAACPSACPNGGDPIIVIKEGKKTCGCDCTTAPACSPGLEQAKDCSCQCPLANCNGHPGDVNNNCACLCPDPGDCIAPRSHWNAAVCKCECPPTACGEGFLADAETCACSCNTVQCPNGRVANPDNDCACECLVECGADQIKVTENNACECRCDPAKSTCLDGFSWEPDPNNPTACRCGCANQCGGGCAAEGASAECEVSATEQCCANCKWLPNGQCDDGNVCTGNDRCQQKADGSPGYECRGDPKCNEPVDTCTQIQCLTDGTCQETKTPDGEACGAAGTTPDQWDRCTTECKDGLCQSKPPPDCSAAPTDAVDCSPAVCNPTTLKCDGGPNVGRTCIDPASCEGSFCDPATGMCKTGTEVGKPCNDGNSCTFNDQCDPNGVCAGELNECLDVEQKICHEFVCNPLIGECEARASPFGADCAADGSNLCQTDGQCAGGICLFGKTCETLTGADGYCKTNVCDPATGQCQHVNRENNLPCLNENGFAVEDDFCGTFKCVGGKCKRQVLPHRANHSVCSPGIVAGAMADNTAGWIVGISAVGALLIMIALAILLCLYVQKQGLTDPSLWSPDNNTGVEANPLYADNANGGVNPMYAN